MWLMAARKYPTPVRMSARAAKASTNRQGARFRQASIAKEEAATKANIQLMIPKATKAVHATPLYRAAHAPIRNKPIPIPVPPQTVRE